MHENIQQSIVVMLSNKENEVFNEKEYLALSNVNTSNTNVDFSLPLML